MSDAPLTPLAHRTRYHADENDPADQFAAYDPGTARRIVELGEWPGAALTESDRPCGHRSAEVIAVSPDASDGARIAKRCRICGRRWVKWIEG